MLIDLAELSDKPPGEALELLTEALLRALGADAVWSGRGPDGGRDLICIEQMSSVVQRTQRRWVVQCKDFRSGAAVGESHLPSIRDALAKHKVEGYLLVTTSVPTAELVRTFKSLTESGVLTRIWNARDLEEHLLRPECAQVLRRFLPRSFGRVSDASEEDVLLRRLHRHGYSETSIRAVKELLERDRATRALAHGGEALSVWPGTTPHHAVIQRAIEAVSRSGDDALEALEELPYEEWLATVTWLGRERPESLQRLLNRVALDSPSEDRRFTAVQLLIDRSGLKDYELGPYVGSLDESSHQLICERLGLDVVLQRVLETSLPSDEAIQDVLASLPPRTVINETALGSIRLTDNDGDGIGAEVRYTLSGTSWADDEEDEGVQWHFPGTAVLNANEDQEWALVDHSVTLETESVLE